MESIKESIKPDLHKNLQKITFTKFNKNTGHGNMYEVLIPAIQSALDKPVFISSNIAMDIMRLNIGYRLEDNTEKELNNIL